MQRYLEKYNKKERYFFFQTETERGGGERKRENICGHELGKPSNKQ